MTRHDVHRLPKWAQELIRQLARRAREAEAMAEQDWLEERPPMPAIERVIFTDPGRPFRSIYFPIKFGDRLVVGDLEASSDGRRLRVTAERELLVLPRATNCVELDAKEERTT
jgi:hypothetical protein